MGYKALQPPTARFSRDEYFLFDDFLSYNDADLWTKLAADTVATVAHEGSVGKSRLKLAVTTTDNNEAAVATTNELFKFIANKSIVGEGLIEYAEGATNVANVAFGFADAIGANLITDDGAGVTATDACLIYKVDGGTTWRFHTELGTLANKAGDGSSGAPAAETISDTTAGGTTAQTLRIEIVPRSSTVFEARPYVNGVQLKTASGIPIVHALALGTATDMDFGAYLKMGSSTSETLYVDYLYAAQVRI